MIISLDSTTLTKSANLPQDNSKGPPIKVKAEQKTLSIHDPHPPHTYKVPGSNCFVGKNAHYDEKGRVHLTHTSDFSV